MGFSMPTSCWLWAACNTLLYCCCRPSQLHLQVAMLRLWQMPSLRPPLEVICAAVFAPVAPNLSTPGQQATMHLMPGAACALQHWWHHPSFSAFLHL